MPQDYEAEQAVIGAIIRQGDLIERARELLQGNEFYNHSHRRIYRAMEALNDSEHPVAIDLLTLTGKLTDTEELDDIGGVSYLSRLASSVPSTANIEHYIARVLDKHTRRKIIEESKLHIDQALESTDINSVLSSMQNSVINLADQAAPAREFKPIKNVLVEVYDDIEKLYNNRGSSGGVTGIPSGFSDLDKMTSGFQRSDLIIVAARPSVGKTAFALNIAENVGLKSKETVGIFSLEMSASQLVKRMVSSEGNVDASRLRTGYFEGEDWEKITMSIGSLSNSNIFIDDSPYLTVHEIRSKCRRLKKENGLGLVLIDYLQLIAGRGKGENRQQEVSEISRMLKQMARELDVPVIALSQLSRGVEQRQDKRPMLSDLRESGSIEQDADIVAFLYRDDYYNKESEKKNTIEIIIAKQRNGPVGTVELAFLKNYNKFVTLDKNHEPFNESTRPPKKNKSA
ncbi:replicative DNA helicase [Paenibacillus albiflavus]|uniref:Replicative DNA helicase n=1 Tax=Paenibacillus albiflavus TaxID=2545760 RepID=A0A4R4EDU9_9BACL|nr:replicative DNA helicase [Paenibacillus albiflavus]TCZ76198.1 replicative DNA helicase [Paenibacillus albiflavus]